MDVEVDVVKLVPCLIKINYETGHWMDTKQAEHHLENGRLETLMSYQLTELMNLKEAVWLVKEEAAESAFESRNVFHSTPKLLRRLLH